MILLTLESQNPRKYNTGAILSMYTVVASSITFRSLTACPHLIIYRYQYICSLMMIQVYLVNSLAIDTFSIIKGNKACKDGNFGYSRFNELADPKQCWQLEFDAMMSLSGSFYTTGMLTAVVLFFYFKRTFPNGTSSDQTTP